MNHSDSLAPSWNDLHLWAAPPEGEALQQQRIHAGVVASAGSAYGPSAAQHIRFSFATSEAVLTEGFEWQGRPYRSLSAIARAITGTRWNGLVFFGLKSYRGAA